MAQDRKNSEGKNSQGGNDQGKNDQGKNNDAWMPDKKDASEGGPSPDEPGEGNRAADRRYRESTERFVQAGRVGPAADEARRAIDDDRERREMEEAERIGRSHAKEHDPEVKPR